MFIDGDFKSDKGTCKYHCYPSCHPAQVGPESVYGCTHKAWYSNRMGDFVPIVECNGNPENCELKEKRFKKMVGEYKRGKTNSLNNALKKAERLQNELDELSKLLK